MTTTQPATAGTGKPSARPLAGVRVLDLSRVLAGPYCGMVLADMGADVIKIENPDGGDESRGFLEPSYHGHSPYFLTVNRNKRSVALDLKAPGGKTAFLKLVAKSDVVLENFRTGVMERLGLGYETLKALRPGLVYCAISGYGRSGPNVEVPGFDPIAQAESGLMSVIGEPDRQPVRTGPSLVDMVTGLFASQAISAALRHQAVTGEGQFIEATLHETALNMLVNFAGVNLLTGVNPTRTGNTNQVAQPAGLYEGSDGPFVLAAITDGQFRNLARAAGRADMIDDPRFATKAARVRNTDAIIAELQAAFRSKPRADWVGILRDASVPAGIVATVAEAMASDLVSSRGAVQRVTHTATGDYAAVMSPTRLHESEPASLRGAPLLGEHTREVLRDIAGMSADEIAVLERAGAAASHG